MLNGILKTDNKEPSRETGARDLIAATDLIALKGDFSSGSYSFGDFAKRSAKMLILLHVPRCVTGSSMRFVHAF